MNEQDKDNSTESCTNVSDVAELISKRDLIEAEIINLNNKLRKPVPQVQQLSNVGTLAAVISASTIGGRLLLNRLHVLKSISVMLNVTATEPLVDEEGYPRSDIDIAAVRQIRHDIICKKNDCNALNKKIEEGLIILHAKEKIVPTSSCMNAREVFFKPFAKVDFVDEDSPAQRADLRVGDFLVKFGTLKYHNFENMQALANLVMQNIRRPIHVSVMRNDKVVPLILVPDDWSGNGYLGCFLVSVKPSCTKCL